MEVVMTENMTRASTERTETLAALSYTLDQLRKSVNDPMVGESIRLLYIEISARIQSLYTTAVAEINLAYNYADILEERARAAEQINLAYNYADVLEQRARKR
jgi:hypothetical protein